MYPPIIAVLDELLPAGFHTISHAKVDRGDKPDLQVLDRNSALVAHIEVKHASTITAAFVVKPGASTHQIGRYRVDGIPVILTDAINWYDVSESDDITRPRVTFNDGDTTSDEASAAQLKSWLHTACGVKARHNLESAVHAISGVIAQINGADSHALASGWTVVRSGLGMVLDADSLDGDGVGEVVAFTLLAIATQLPDLPAATFVTAATAEWGAESDRWDPGTLPSMMGATLRAFRDEDRRLNILGAGGWVTVRSVAAWVVDSSRPERWARLSDTWDAYLHHVGRRKTLGSWQTPRSVADYQAGQVSAALEQLGYSGLTDNAVTVIDPCCGTGVYLDAVLAASEAAGLPPEVFNAPATGGYPRLVGVDISSTALAAAHIRVAVSGARPALHMTDTLAAGSTGSLLSLFAAVGGQSNPIVSAARDDFEEVNRWATRDHSADRGPVLAVIGNPPYLRSGLDTARYASMGWMTDAFENWKAGSGGRGGLEDLFAGFWAWAITLCRQEHPGLDAYIEALNAAGQPAAAAAVAAQAVSEAFGVVSFITNRIWIDGKTFSPMRAWVAGVASHIDITDFGPGPRGGGAGRWSAQPFAIETGTAIVTLTFNPAAPKPATITYRRAQWVNQQVVLEPSETYPAPDQPIIRKKGLPIPGNRSWMPSATSGHMGGATIYSGIVTGDDTRWVRVTADREFTVAHAYRPFDNRWLPTTPPPKAARKTKPTADQSPASAWWREDTVWTPHAAFRKAGGWYAIMQFDRALPGPAIHAARHIPNHHVFKGSQASVVVRVSPGCDTPPDYRGWAESHGLDGGQFWLYMLAAGHHLDYWTADSPMAEQLAQKCVAPPRSEDDATIAKMIELGGKLVDLWSLDTVTPAAFTGGPGAWHFAGHNEADAILVHGQRVLSKWRAARLGDWDQRRATEYARTVAAILGVRAAADEVAGLLGA